MSSRNVVIGGLYVVPWEMSVIIGDGFDYGSFGVLQENDVVVLLDYNEDKNDYTSFTFTTTYYNVKVLTPTGEVGTVKASDSSLREYWKLAKNVMK